MDFKHCLEIPFGAKQEALHAACISDEISFSSILLSKCIMLGTHEMLKRKSNVNMSSLLSMALHHA